jgi:putative transposase
MEPHRKRVRHFHEPGDFHELTFSCYRRLPLLSTDPWRQMLCRAIDRALLSHEFALAAFVIMPEHVHLLVYPCEHAAKTLAAQSRRQWHPTRDLPASKSIVHELSRLLADIKRPFSGRIKAALAKTDDPLLAELIVLERPGKWTFRFWQEGPGYDRNLTSQTTVLSAIDYIHLNPVRRGLVARAVDWKWSSARVYVSDGNDHDPDLPSIKPPPVELFD